MLHSSYCYENHLHILPGGSWGSMAQYSITIQRPKREIKWLLGFPSFDYISHPIKVCRVGRSLLVMQRPGMLSAG